MNFNIDRMDYKPDDYRAKKLLWFRHEHEGHFTLFPSVPLDGTTFALTAYAAGTASPGSSKSINQIAVVARQIDMDLLRKIEKPKSRFLRPICDYVIFDGSPRAQARFGV
jgi:hypothetical protein